MALLVEESQDYDVRVLHLSLLSHDLHHKIGELLLFAGNLEGALLELLTLKLVIDGLR